jgi:hypothetical protein
MRQPARLRWHSQSYATSRRTSKPHRKQPCSSSFRYSINLPVQWPRHVPVFLLVVHRVWTPTLPLNWSRVGCRKDQRHQCQHRVCSGEQALAAIGDIGQYFAVPIRRQRSPHVRLIILVLAWSLRAGNCHESTCTEATLCWISYGLVRRQTFLHSLLVGRKSPNSPHVEVAAWQKPLLEKLGTLLQLVDGLYVALRS